MSSHDTSRCAASALWRCGNPSVKGHEKPPFGIQNRDEGFFLILLIPRHGRRFSLAEKYSGGKQSSSRVRALGLSRRDRALVWQRRHNEPCPQALKSPARGVAGLGPKLARL